MDHLVTGAMTKNSRPFLNLDCQTSQLFSKFFVVSRVCHDQNSALSSIKLHVDVELPVIPVAQSDTSIRFCCAVIKRGVPTLWPTELSVPDHSDFHP